MTTLNIGELAHEAGLRTSSIRFYESVGLLPPPARQSGWRRYDVGILDRLKVIQVARQMDFSLAEIKELLDGFPIGTPPSERWRDIADRKLPELDEIIQRVIALKYLIESGLDCTCEDISLCINSHGMACRPDDPSLKSEHSAEPHICSDEHCECE